MVCKTCKPKAEPAATYTARCEICYQNFETAIPGAVVCENCSELGDFCQICKESIQDF